MAASATDEVDLSLTDKGNLVDALWHSVDDAAGNLEIVPGLVKRVLETGAWRERIHRGKRFHHDRFIDFITIKPLAGCGWEPEKVEALIRDEPETLALWRRATTAKAGGDRQSEKAKTISSIRTNASDVLRGTTRAYTLDRLKRERPDLFEQVCAKELSANAAAIEAGWRKKKSELQLLRLHWQKASADEQETFRKEIQ
jgi:hypothetical protein